MRCAVQRFELAVCNGERLTAEVHGEFAVPVADEDRFNNSVCEASSAAGAIARRGKRGAFADITVIDLVDFERDEQAVAVDLSADKYRVELVGKV